MDEKITKSMYNTALIPLHGLKFPIIIKPMQDPSAMQKIASNTTTLLLWDYSETQTFYTYDIGTRAFTQLSSQDAQNWYNTQPKNSSPGLTFWGYTVIPSQNPYSFKAPAS